MERELHARTEMAIATALAVDVLTSDPAAVLSTVVDDDAPPGVYVTELLAELGPGPAVRQPIVVELDDPEVVGDAVRWPIRWHPVLHARLLPAFRGHLECRPAGDATTLLLDGAYRPPLGHVGKFGDGVLGHRIARSCASAFVADVADRLVSAAGRPLEPVTAGRPGA